MGGATDGDDIKGATSLERGGHKRFAASCRVHGVRLLLTFSDSNSELSMISLSDVEHAAAMILSRERAARTPFKSKVAWSNCSSDHFRIVDANNPFLLIMINWSLRENALSILVSTDFDSSSFTSRTKN